MAMTKSRRATPRPKRVVDPLAVLTDTDEFVEQYNELRKAVSEEFKYLKDSGAGEDRTVAYTQKMHWAFLSMAAANKVAVRALLRALKDTNKRLAEAEAAILRKSVPEGLEWMQPIPRSRSSKRGSDGKNVRTEP